MNAVPATMKINNSYLTPGSGKTNPTVRWVAQNPVKITGANGTKYKPAGIVYVTTREEVETLDVMRFLTNFGPEQPKSRLRQSHAQIIFTITGYEDSELDLFEIPEVRRFYGLLHEIWPCWIYASSLLGTSLRALALCVIQNMTVQRTEKECRIRVAESELRAFLAQSSPVTALLHDRAGICRRHRACHLSAVAAYLGIGGK